MAVRLICPWLAGIMVSLSFGAALAQKTVPAQPPSDAKTQVSMMGISECASRFPGDGRWYARIAR